MYHYTPTQYIISSNECLWFIIGFITATIFFFALAYALDHLQKKHLSQRILRVQSAHQKQQKQYEKWIHNTKAEVLNKAEGGQQNG